MPIMGSPSSTRWTGFSLRGITEFTDSFTTVASDIDGLLTSDVRAKWTRETSASFPLSVSTSGQLASNAASQNVIYTFDKQYNSGSIQYTFNLTNCANNAVYLRYFDQNNWMRVVLTNTANSTYSVCGLQYNGVYYWTDSTPNDCFGISSTANPATETSTLCGSQVTTTYNSWSYRPDCYSVTVWSLVAYTFYSYSEVYYTIYPISYTLSLQQCVSGVVTTLSSGTTSTSGSAGYPSTPTHTINVTFNPSQISYSLSGGLSISTTTTSTTTLNQFYKFGIGRTSNSSYHTSSAADSVTVASS